MNELALFAGGGGSIWASALLGHRVVCAVEVEAFQRSVLLARQRDGSFPVFPVWDDIRTFDGRPWHGAVDLVSGGFPCTDISLAGKGAGIDGEKSGLWREMARVIADVQPRFVFVENVRALVSRGLDRVLGDLADLGFDAEWDCFRASDVGAPHKRERLFILAYRASSRRERPKDARTDSGDAGEGVRCAESERGGGKLADPSNGQFQESGRRPQGRDGAGSAGADMADANEQHGDRAWSTGQGRRIESPDGRQRMADADSRRQQRKRRGGLLVQERSARRHDTDGCGGPWPPVPGDAAGWLEYTQQGGPQPAICRGSDGLADRSKRLATLGNGWVPQVAALAWHTLTNRMNGDTNE